jgi:hypothetical protein
MASFLENSWRKRYRIPRFQVDSKVPGAMPGIEDVCLEFI